MEGIALTAEDRAILDLESSAVAGHTCKVIVIDGALGVEELRESIGRRIDSEPALRRRLAGPPQAPVWVDDDDFHIANHVVAAPAAEPGALRDAVARLFAQRLDRSRPLWRIDVVPLDAGAALVWRTHHALADGSVAMRFAEAVLWDPAPDAPPPRPRRAGGDPGRHLRLAAFVRDEVHLGAGRSPFDGSIGTGREVAFARAPLPELHDAAKRLAGATVNDAVLAAISGSLRDWIEHHHGQLGGVRVKIPVSLHHAGDGEGNRDSFFTLELPLGEPDPLARLTAIRAATAKRKADHDAETLDVLLRDLAAASPRLAQFCRRLQANPRAFALNVSNVPGPPGPVSVLGARVTDVWSLAEIGQRHALRVSVVSAAGRLQFGFCSDPAIVADIERLARGVEAQAAALVAIG